jgi:hypothetical protein
MRRYQRVSFMTDLASLFMKANHSSTNDIFLNYERVVLVTTNTGIKIGGGNNYPAK